MKQHGKGSEGGHGRLDALGSRWRAPDADDLLLALDDTDNLESPGTGFRARELAALLVADDLAEALAITRHQLLVDPAIPYTSHNSSACIVLGGVSGGDGAAAVFSLACDYLARTAAVGSDVGVCMLRRGQVNEALVQWGRDAQQSVLTLEAARALARDRQLVHAELSGTGGGLIGALAAIGLHATGNDGRLLWLRGLRAAAGRQMSIAELARDCAVSCETVCGERVGEALDRVELGDWPRAIYRRHQPILLVESNHESTNVAWRCVPRELVKRF